MFCSHCNINWSTLWTEYDHEGDEVYDFCPICKSDAFLKANIEGPRYFKTIIGDIFNVETKEKLQLQVKALPPVKPNYMGRDHVRSKAMMEREDQAIDDYIRAIEQGNSNAAQQYFNRLKL